MTWKQPIPVTFDLGDDWAADTMLTLLLRSAAETDQKVYIGDHVIQLHRGQAIFSRYQYGKRFDLDRTRSGRVTRILKRLAKMHNRIDIRPTNRCTIVTIRNYDDLVKMDTRIDIKTTPGRHLDDTHKNVKSVKNREIAAKLDDLQLYQISRDADIYYPEVKRKYSALLAYDTGKRKKYKDHNRALRNWLSSDIDRGYLHTMTEVERLDNSGLDPVKRAKFQGLIDKFEEAHGAH